MAFVHRCGTRAGDVEGPPLIAILQKTLPHLGQSPIVPEDEERRSIGAVLAGLRRLQCHVAHGKWQYSFIVD